MGWKKLTSLRSGTNSTNLDNLYKTIEKLKKLGATTVAVSDKKNKIYVNFLMTNPKNKDIITAKDYIQASNDEMLLLDDPVEYISKLEGLPTGKVRNEERD